MRGLIAIASLVVLVGCQEAILHDLDETKANSILLMFEKNNISAEKKRSGSGWDVQVSSAKRKGALELLEHYRLNRSDKVSAVSNASILQTREERELSALSKSSQRVEEILAGMPGVLEARVIISAAQGGLAYEASAKMRPGRVGVFLVAEQRVPFAEEQIKELVAAAVGVSAQDIGLVFVRESRPNLQAVVLPAEVRQEVSNGADSKKTELEQFESKPEMKGVSANAGAGRVGSDAPQLAPRRWFEGWRIEVRAICAALAALFSYLLLKVRRSMAAPEPQPLRPKSPPLQAELHPLRRSGEALSSKSAAEDDFIGQRRQNQNLTARR